MATDWISLHARDEAGRGTLSGDRINRLREMIPEKLVKVAAPGLLLWSPSEPDHERTTPGKGPLSSLSPREREILDWTREGKTSGEIAVILGRATRTIEKHLENIYRKLGVRSRSALILSFTEAPSLTPGDA